MLLSLEDILEMFWIFKAIVNFWTGLRDTQFCDTTHTGTSQKGVTVQPFFIQSEVVFFKLKKIPHADLNHLEVLLTDSVRWFIFISQH